MRDNDEGERERQWEGRWGGEARTRGRECEGKAPPKGRLAQEC